MAALKRSLAEAPATKRARARKATKASPDRTQRALLLPPVGWPKKEGRAGDRSRRGREKAAQKGFDPPPIDLPDAAVDISRPDRQPAAIGMASLALIARFSNTNSNLIEFHRLPVDHLV